MGRSKHRENESSLEMKFNGEMPGDFTFFKDFSFNVEALSVQWGILSSTAIQDVDLSEDELSAILLSQIDLRDTFIESLSMKCDTLVAKGRELEACNRYLKQKILDLQDEECSKSETECGSCKSRKENDSSRRSVVREQDAVANCSDCKNGVKDIESSSRVSRRGSDGASPLHRLPSPSHWSPSPSHRSPSPSHRSLSPSQRSPSPNEVKRKNSQEEIIEKNSDSAKDKIKAMVAMALKAQGYDVEENSVPDKFEDLSDSSDAENEKNSDVGWSTEGGQSVTDQVKAVASEAVIHSGYVYQEELGLYYDHTSGYYYNAENGLYYDTKTGTYFFYDHATRAYQFHSQVQVEGNSEADAEQGNVNASSRDRSSSDYQPEGQDIPPSLRLMVTESGVDKVKVGDLHLVTMHGGKAGRGTDNLVQLLDIKISEEHAEFIYHSNDHDDHHYFVKDLGSTNGTFINGTCICLPGEPSDEIEIGHGWELQFGTVKLKCHIHPGYLSCNECEPGLVLANQPSQSGSEQSTPGVKASIEKKRLKILKAMKKKYSINPHITPAFNFSDYEDRAKKRRKEKGSDNPYEKTEVASTETELRDNNKGFELLQKMGWSKGQGLGKSQPGIIEPIETKSTVGREGLGYSMGLPPPTEMQRKRKKILDVTARRFKL